MFHSVTQFSETGEQLESYDTTSAAAKDTGFTMTQIRDHYSGKRKYCFWYSHIYKNDIVLYDGTVIKPKNLIMSNYELDVVIDIQKRMKELGYKLVKE